MTYACEPNIPPNALKCTTTHCTSFAGTEEEIAWCKCIRFDGQKIPGCDPKSNTVPVKTGVCYNKVTKEQKNISVEACQDLRDSSRNWSWTDCYCCCSCFAWFTKILIPENQVKFVQTIQPHDKVMAGSIDITDGKINVTWDEAEVGFSDGTSPGAPSQMIVIQYGVEGEITATSDQLFLLPDGKLKSANRLSPLDQLVGEDGSTIDIVKISVVAYTGGIHHIGLGEPDPPDPIVPINGHLIGAEGLICGDFWLQVTHASSDAKSTLLVENHESLPMIGSAEYTQQKGYSADLFSATRDGATPRAIRNPFCEEQTLKDGAALRAGARQYLTAMQAADINANPADFYPISVEVNVPDYKIIRSIFACNYPDVNIYLEWTDDYPNLYAFEAFGQKTVYISGRLLRAKGIYKEGVAMMLAFGVALFYAGDDNDQDIATCTGLADYFGAGYILRQAFTFNWLEMSTGGYEQIRELWKKITKANRKGDPNNRCLLPSIDCRLESMSNALSGKGVPACTGVPGPGRLTLDSARAAIVEDTQSVIAVFSEPVDPETSQQVTNYTITPETVITTAVRDEREPAQVVLTVTLPDPPDGDYTLTVSDVTAANGSTLNPNARTADFKFPPD